MTHTKQEKFYNSIYSVDIFKCARSNENLYLNIFGGEKQKRLNKPFNQG